MKVLDDWLFDHLRKVSTDRGIQLENDLEGSQQNCKQENSLIKSYKVALALTEQ